MSQTQSISQFLVSQIKQMTLKAEQLYFDFKFLLSMPNSHKLKLFALLPYSKSQLRQDLFVLSSLSFMQRGYFVEFGAANGYELSNTYLLETEKHWTGILAEPAKCWHRQLQMQRPNSIVESKCVWRNSGSSITFVETPHSQNSRFLPIWTVTRGRWTDTKLRRSLCWIC